MSERRRKLVVAGLIVDGDRVLVTRRRADQPMGGFWEFPGGKIEDGESPEMALERELREEIGAAVEIGPIWDVLFHRYPDFDLLMLIYCCQLRPGEVSCAVEVAELAWCLPPELEGLSILPADGPLVARLNAEGVPPWASRTTVAAPVAVV